MQGNNVGITLAVKVCSANVVVIDQCRTGSSSLEELQKVDLEGSQIDLVIPITFIENLVHDVWLVGSGLDETVAKPLEEVLMLLPLIPSRAER